MYPNTEQLEPVLRASPVPSFSPSLLSSGAIKRPDQNQVCLQSVDEKQVDNQNAKQICFSSQSPYCQLLQFYHKFCNQPFS